MIWAVIWAAGFSPSDHDLALFIHISPRGYIFFSNDAGELCCHFIKIERTGVQRVGERDLARGHTLLILFVDDMLIMGDDMEHTSL